MCSIAAAAMLLAFMRGENKVDVVQPARFGLEGFTLGGFQNPLLLLIMLEGCEVPRPLEVGAR